jgi:2-succinyl-6-hydroxy-2,4-cyclohexadiene-1-carboxylate synthase
MSIGSGVRLVAIHGFLGGPTDWADLPDRFPGTTVVAVDLWAALAGSADLDWASAIEATDRALARALPAEDGRPAFVVGYSLGARLALGSRVLSAAASPVRGCVFVSCNPGLADADRGGREARFASDQAWGRRILANAEPELWDAWDAQPVFAGSLRQGRRGGLPAPRAEIARVLLGCSLGGQPDLRPPLRAWPTPVLWVTGERDPKFCAIATELEAGGVSADFVRCRDAGHRVPWDNPSAFAGIVSAWTARVLETQP